MKHIITFLILITLACPLQGRRRGLQTPLTDDTVGLWHFNEDTGDTAHDLTANNNHGTITGALWVESPMGKALDFDGVDDYVSLENYYFSDGAKSISAWIKTDSVSNDYQGIVGNWWWNSSGGGEQMNLGLNYDKLFFHKYSDDKSKAVSINSVSTFQTDEWYHIAAIYESDGFGKIYINGVEENSDNFPVTIDNYKENVLIGHWRVSDTADLSRPFNGQIDDVSIYNKALSEAEIKHIYELQKPLFKHGGE